MSRLSVLLHNPKRLVLALAALAVAAAVVIGTGAVFTSTSANPSNTFSAGNLSQTNSKSGAAILTASLLKPGDSTNGNVTITNSGDIDGTFTLSESNVTSTPGPNAGNLSTKLDLLIEDVTVPLTPVTVYSGKLNAVPSTALGTFTAGEARDYKFTVTFPDGGTPPGPTTGDNAYKSSAASAQFNWNAVQ